MPLTRATLVNAPRYNGKESLASFIRSLNVYLAKRRKGYFRTCSRDPFETPTTRFLKTSEKGVGTAFLIVYKENTTPRQSDLDGAG
ncbi:Transposase [Caenorhabditis elegans]|uniref:Transposase n=1 Tax=Caenorhabditis elegans TaxID=6239 RepID=G1K0Y5_CAEEL|nr:Transposase [Caenorhabditis elegans]CCC42167.1 Transposase [Caenorhabditis elegans]|eukprot:NP_001256823.1 Uncharacterized protein CELE_F11D11.21 [Caenorhabditis elegans]